MFHFGQIILSVLMFLCVVIEVIAHGFVNHNISGIGWLVALLFLVLSFNLVRISVNEYIEERKK